MSKRKKGTEKEILTPEAIEALNAITEDNAAEPIEANVAKEAKPPKRRRGRPSHAEINEDPASHIKGSDFAAVIARLNKMAEAIAKAEAVVKAVEDEMRADPLLRIWVGPRTTNRARNFLKEAYKTIHGRKAHRERAAAIAKREVKETNPFVKKTAKKQKTTKVKHNAHVFQRKTD